jgi:CRISPR-associated exonuclease Cas4
MFNITGTEVNYLFICKRKLYLHHHKLYQEQNSELVKIGKYLHEERFSDELSLEGIKFDKIDGEFVTEYKKTKADLKAGEWQLIYYLWRLERVGVFRKGKLEYGKNREFKIVEISEQKRKELESYLEEIEKILASEKIPKVIDKPKCKKCSYFDYCFV